MFANSAIVVLALYGLRINSISSLSIPGDFLLRIFGICFLDSGIFIMIKYSCNVYPFTSHFYIVKLGYTFFSYFCSKT